ncbi:TPA: LPXTG cell wall anchor domain-containing protein [Streptococcus suis]|uniref:Spy0128 family protein n=1 Tax=Streptococcus suis TaxID=1307 RepID=UPI00155295F5|nr:FctA domain-containing protein [Streptococcus suis]MCV6616562.1 LPXTG cell wall anchor domain-containing protein [Streptococcus suis]MCV6618327.1 LPXTG cell wall anchor domain-containing protein [Streptococcus suis]MCV6632980.1 LPXTG cell wall anchor domain-containing protein [Streptococcus suis]NQL21432.1 LPXTG cell wall anchor domain-containing protein [Streptococcus suis]NQL30158.1 LPXTG cell wall anchor domain-containing protein [Streptococcus suis]
MNTKKWRTSLLIPGIVLFGTVALVNNVSAQEVKNTIISAKQPDGGQATSKTVNVKIPAVVRLFGRDLLENEFKFELREVDSEKLIDTTQNTKEGQVRFKNLSFDKPGEYWYTISEVKNELSGVEYDSKYIVAKITVEDRNNGQLQAMIEFIADDNVFNNFYTPAPAAASLSIKKVLEGRTLNTGEFEFVLKNEKGDEIEKVSNQADGSVNFSALTFTKEGTYTYTVSEVDGGLGDIIYDKSDIKATVTVKDNNHGQLVSTVTYENSDQIFENILKPGKLIAPTTDSVITDNEVSKEAMTDKEKGNIEPPKEQIANEEKDNIESSEKQKPSIVNDMVVTPEKQMTNKENDKVETSEKQMPSVMNENAVTPEKQMTNKENDKVETSEKQMPSVMNENAVTPEKQMTNKENDNIVISEKQMPSVMNENAVTPEKQMTNKENDKVVISEKQMPVNEKDNAVTPEKQTDNKVNDEVLISEKQKPSIVNDMVVTPEKQMTNKENDKVVISEKQKPSVVNENAVTPEKQMTNKENDKVETSEKQMPSIVNDMVVTPQEQMANKENDKVETSEKQMPVNEKDNAVTPEKQMANKEKENIETSKKQIPVNENNQNGTVEENSNTKPTTEKTDKQETSTFKTETAKQILPVTGEKGSLWLLTSGIIGLAIALFTRKRKL